MSLATPDTPPAPGAGVPERRTARLVILDPADRVLLIQYRAQRAVDPLRPGLRAFWFTPGGGIEPGESAEQAALREMREEVGLTGLPLGPEIATRAALVDLFQRIRFCRERYFLVRAPDARFDTRDLQATDADEVLDVRWWPVATLGQLGAPLLPRLLVPLLARVAAGDIPARPVDLGEDVAA
jgi:8-oxo-dGTP pyrophosphatase MutT (NUDIX family)